jgi:hypothetical protein
MDNNNNNNFNEELNKKINDEIEDAVTDAIKDALGDAPEIPNIPGVPSEPNEPKEPKEEIDTEALMNTIKASIKESLAAAGILTKVGFDAAKVGAKTGYEAAKVGAKTGYNAAKAGMKDLAHTIKKNLDDMKAAKFAEDCCDCDDCDVDCDCGCGAASDCFSEMFNGKNEPSFTMSHKEAQYESDDTLKFITSRIDTVIANMQKTVDTLMNIDGPNADSRIVAFGNIATESEQTNREIISLLNKMYDDMKAADKDAAMNAHIANVIETHTLENKVEILQKIKEIYGK